MNEPDKVDGQGVKTTVQNETSLSPVETTKQLERRPDPGGAMGKALAGAIENAREIFGFKEKFIHLGSEGAYHVNQKVQPYGPGALYIGRVGGVYIHTPQDLVHEDGKLHKNPYIIRNDSGVIKEANYRKVVIHMNETGHVKFKDFIYSRSITVDLARAAMKLMMDTNVPMNAKRFATQKMVDLWNKASTTSAEPGVPLWLFYELPNNPVGVAINSNDPHELVLNFIKKNVELENTFKSSTETKAEKRSIWYVIPDSFKPLEGEYAPKISGGTVNSASFRVMAPTKAGVLLVLIQKFLMAMLAEDQEAVLKAKEAFAVAMGTTPDAVHVTEVNEGELDPATDPDRFEAQRDAENQKAAVVDTDTGEVQLDPVPKSIKDITEFQNYVAAQIPKLTEKELKYLGDRGTKYVDASVFDTNQWADKLPGAITAEHASKFATAFRNIIKKRETTKKDEPAGKDITVDQAKEHIATEMTEGNVNKVTSIFEAHKIAPGISLEEIADDVILSIYSELTKPPEPKIDSTGQAKLI